MTASEDPVEVAIVGGGIVGLILTAGLTRRGVRVKVFEQAHNFREIGAGMGFTANTIRCMNEIHPGVVTALRAGGAVNASLDKNDSKSYLRWLDGYTQSPDEESIYQKLLCEIDAGVAGWEMVRRDRFLEDLVKIIPEEVVNFQKRLDEMEDSPGSDKVLLKFTDGSVAEADAVIGCDGIKSRTRHLMLGDDNPASYPQYTHKVAYRGLIPMDKAVQAIGEYKAYRQHFHIGPNAHIIHYPVNTTTMNITYFITDTEDWSHEKPTTARGSRKNVEAALENWSTPVRNLVDLLPDELDQWALFDLFEYPVPKYNKGLVCLAGDAAHGSSPHHGAGASMGVEDALCLSTLMSAVIKNAAGASKADALKSAFETFDTTRRTRSQWLVNSSRRVCDLYQQPDWADPSKRIKAETCFEEIKDRSFKIWNFDLAGMVEETIRDYKRRTSQLRGLSMGDHGNESNGTNGHLVE